MLGNIFRTLSRQGRNRKGRRGNSSRQRLSVETLETRDVPAYSLINASLYLVNGPIQTLVDTNVKSYGTVGTSAIDLHNDGHIYKVDTAGSRQLLLDTSNPYCLATSLAVDPRGTVYELNEFGQIFQSQANANWQALLNPTNPDCMAKSMALTSNGSLFELNQFGQLFRDQSGSWQLVVGPGATGRAGTHCAVGLFAAGGGIDTWLDDGSAWFSPDGNNVAGGGNTTLAYAGTQRIVQMVGTNAGVVTLFSGGTPYFSPDGRNLGGGGNTTHAYDGSQRVINMVAAGGGIDTLFSAGGAYFSPDGRNLGGGGNTTLAYAGSQHIVHLVAAGGGIVTLFDGGGVYFSPDGRNLGGGGNTIRFGLGSLSVTQGTVYQHYSGTINGIIDGITQVAVTGLPPGLSWTLSGNTINISGTLPTKSGLYTIGASLSLANLPWAKVSQTYGLTVNPGPAASFAVSAPGTATVGTGFGVTVTAKDAYDNTATGFSGTVTLTSSNGQSVPPVSVRVTNGTGSGTLTPKHSGTATLTASAGSIKGSSGVITVYPSLYSYSFTLYAWDHDDNLLATLNFSCSAQNDGQAISFLQNKEAVWGQQLDGDPDTEDWFKMTFSLRSKTALN
jgi:hypothetical protein